MYCRGKKTLSKSHERRGGGWMRAYVCHVKLSMKTSTDETLMSLMSLEVMYPVSGLMFWRIVCCFTTFIGMIEMWEFQGETLMLHVGSQ